MTFSTRVVGAFFRMLFGVMLLTFSGTGLVCGQIVPVNPSGTLNVDNPTCAPITGFTVRLRFDTGENHVIPATSNWVSSTVNVSVSGGGINVSNVALTIKPDSPEKWYVVSTGNSALTPGTPLTLSATASAVSSIGTAPSVRVMMECVPEYSAVFNSPSSIDASTPPAKVNTSATGFEYAFNWTAECSQVATYQLQVLFKSDNSPIIPESEWQEKGLLVETGSSSLTYTLTLAEGVGFYNWRVRAIGRRPGGVSDPANVGKWKAGTQLEIRQADVPNANLNWIYSRTFSEGGRVAEKLTFANGLQQVRQTQTRLAGTTTSSLGKQVLAVQTVQDYAGRDAVQSLPIPILTPSSSLTGPTSLGFKPNLLKANWSSVSYTAADFDGNAVPTGAPASPASPFSQPLPAQEQGYYTSAAAPGADPSVNDRVADAEGYPFSRTRFGPDGRVREQSGAGEAMKVKPENETAHTIRTYYAAVAPQELIRLFGDEAPEANAAYKILSVDPNNTTSVTYQTKEGQTIATALSRASNTNTGPLEPLSSAADQPYMITEELAGTARVTGKTLVISEAPSSVDINYSLTPAILQNSCLAYCATCDYKVRITVTKVNDPSFTPLVKDVLVPAEAVCANPSVRSSTPAPWVVPFNATGEYRIEREIMPADPTAAVPTTAPPVPSVDARLAALQVTLDGLPSQAPWSNINSYLRTADIDGLYNYVINNRNFPVTTSDGAPYAQVGEPYVQIPVPAPTTGTCTAFIYLPYKPGYCNPPCEIGNIDFEAVLDAKLGEINTARGTAFTTADVWGTYPGGAFRELLRNMQQYGVDNPGLMSQAYEDAHPGLRLRYTCKELLACWETQLALLEGNLITVGNAPAGYRYNFVKEFLSCTGVDMTTPVATPATPDPKNIFQEFSYDDNSNYDKQCLIAAYACHHRIDDPAGIQAIDFADVSADLANYSNYEPECRTQAYDCLSSYLPQPNATSLNPQAEAEKAAQEMERNCRSSCNDRRTEFRASLVDSFHQQGIYVAGDLFSLVRADRGEYVFGHLLSADERNQITFIESCQIDILVQALVENCQNDCHITLISAGQGYTLGTADEHRAMSKVMFNGYDLEVRGPGQRCSDPQSTEVVPAGDHLFQAKLTSCAQDVVTYLGALARGVPRLQSQANPPMNCNVPTGTVSYIPDSTPPLNLPTSYSVSGPLRQDCTQTDATCVAEERSLYPGLNRVNHWITIVDSRDTPNTSVQLFQPNFDYVLVWSENGNIPWSCPVSGEDAPGLPRGLATPCGRTTTIADKGPFYQLHFIDENGNPIQKAIIQDVSPAFLDEPFVSTSQLANGLGGGANDLFTAEGVKVRLTLSNGSSMVARLVVTFYKDLTDPRIPDSPTPTMPTGYLQWKTTEECGPTASDYHVCIKWREFEPTTTSGTGPVFTGEPAPCNEVLARELQLAFDSEIGRWQQAQCDDLLQQYQTKCRALAGATEHFTVTYGLGYHHYTLYYYDRGGNLLRTVPPKGVALLGDSEFLVGTALKARASWGRPEHTMETKYLYNNLHQCVSQTTPDGGTTRFYYNRKGQLRFSQNAKQAPLFKYSYTKYDALGRAVEVCESGQGVNTSNGSLTTVVAQVEGSTYPTTGRRQVTTTVYSTPAAGITYSTGSLTGPAYAKYTNSAQRYLTNRVSFTSLDEDGDSRTTADRSATYYSYDPHGNVEWLIQWQSGLGNRYVRYEYDLISNKVLRVNYQEGQEDEFYHRYDYDADNRLTEVHTSTNGLIWDRDAHYEYYAHGPLKRLELGEDRVQGLDYTYTLQGWLKAVNHPSTDANDDPGRDGAAITGTGADAYAMALNYYPGDYVTKAGSFNYQSSQLQARTDGSGSVQRQHPLLGEQHPHAGGLGPKQRANSRNLHL